jgi:hypothetical protein
VFLNFWIASLKSGFDVLELRRFIIPREIFIHSVGARHLFKAFLRD